MIRRLGMNSVAPTGKLLYLADQIGKFYFLKTKFCYSQNRSRSDSDANCLAVPIVP